MCLAIPARIIAMNGYEAEIEIGGVHRSISVCLTPDAEVGDFVYVHTGYAISVVDEAEAQESLRLFRELADTFSTDELFLSTGTPPCQPADN